jgi:hypothetical protein
MADYLEEEKKRQEYEREQEKRKEAAKAAFIADHPAHPEYAQVVWGAAARSLRRYDIDEDGSRLVKDATNLVVELIDLKHKHFGDMPDDDASKILDDLMELIDLRLDISACWDLYRQQQLTQRRNDIQQRYSQSFDMTMGLGQAISGHTGPPPALWGSGFDVLWSAGEPLVIEAAKGVGKTTLAGLLVRGQLLGGDVLGYPVRKLPEGQRILYLALDRPDQIKRSMARQFSPSQLTELDERVVFWQGALPADAAENTRVYVDLCDYNQTDIVYVDSLKDAVRGLSEDRATGYYQEGRTRLLASGRQLVELHHLTKSGDDYGSVWLHAGAGSVLRMSGRAGGPSSVLTHVKQPAHHVGPLKIKHDRDRGEMNVAEAAAPVELLNWIADQTDGVTAAETAQVLFGTAGDSEVKRAKRKLAELVDAGQIRVVTGQGRSNPTRWYVESGH